MVFTDIHQARCLFRGMGLAVTVPDQFDTHQQTAPAYVADDLMVVHQLFETVHQARTHGDGIFTEFFVCDDIHGGLGLGSLHRVTAEGVEIALAFQ